jgi:hypothetical protein
MNSINPETTLFKTASAQGGYFTAFQAEEAGFSPQNHPYHVRTGNWIKEFRGIYRLAKYPLQQDTQYSLLNVWSMNRKGVPQGVFSHETALTLYELSDLQSDKIHMTVPRGYRRHGKIPEVLVLHHSSIHPDEYETRDGYLVTKPKRIVIDLIRSQSVSPEFIRQAVARALEKGTLLHSEFRTLKEMKRIGPGLIEIMESGS